MRFFIQQQFILTAVFAVLIFNCNRHSYSGRQPRNPLLSITEQQTDFRLFRSLMETVHPDLYRRMSPDEANHIFDSVEQTINKPATVIRFYRKIAFLMDYFGCSHCLAQPSDELIDSLKKASVFFPLAVYYCNGKIIVNEKFNTIPYGSEITAIDGRTAAEILSRTSLFAASDVRNDTNDYFKIRNLFAFQYYWAFGKDRYSNFSIAYTEPDGVTHGNISLSAVQFNILTEGNIRPKNLNYDFYINDTIHTGILTIRSFLIDGDQGKAFGNFLKSSFDLMDVRKIPNLIIDLRYNSGGYNTLDVLLRSYITDSATMIAKTEYAKLQTVPMSEYELTSSVCTNHLSINQYLLNTYEMQSNGICPIIPDSMLRSKPDPQNFKGKILILTNPETASAAIRFSAFAQSCGRAKIAGETTSGSASYTNAGYKAGYQLPESKIRLEIPLIHQDYFCIPQAENRNCGLIPDYPVPYTQQDLVNERDPVMEFAMDYFRNHRAI